MLFTTILPLTWLALCALVVVLCRAAARSDAEPVQVIATPESSRRAGLFLWEDTSATVRVSRPPRRPSLEGTQRPRSRRATHSVR